MTKIKELIELFYDYSFYAWEKRIAFFPCGVNIDSTRKLYWDYDKPKGK